MLPGINEMLTRREVLMQVRRVGARSVSQLKRDCREYEQFMAVNYDHEIVKKGLDPQVSNLRSRIG
jgi:hypothetical protein